jgi:ABC-type transporter lipoprotein component MlaA
MPSYDSLQQSDARQATVREMDRQKFVVLAEKRVTRAINDIRLVGNLSNRSNYKYTDEDARKIYRALREALDEMKARFERRGDERGVTFRLE